MNKIIFHKAIQYRIGRHLLFGLLVVIIFTLVLYSRNNFHGFLHLFKLTFVNAIIFLGYGYLTVFVLIPAFLPNKKFFKLGFTFLMLGFMLSAVKLSVSEFIFYSSISPEFIGTKGMLNLRFILINTKDMSFIVALMVVSKFTKDWLIVEKKRLVLQMKYTELNLRLLQWKFDPHFLFNTLNNLYALSLSDLDKALEMIRRFKRLLQFSITDALFQKVKLSKEIDIISDYIQIEQIRYGSRLNIKYTVLGNPDGLLIVPFLLLPLVENCFRHGSSTDLGEPWIDLSLSCESSSICFETRNSIPQKSGRFIPMREEVMLKLKQRLEVIYPRKYDLKLFNESDVFAVKLNLDLS